MSEKHLTELAWKTFAVRKHIKDGELTKALAALGKADEKDPGSKLPSLDKILTTAETLKRDNKSDDEVVDYLDEVLKEARKTKTTAAAATKKTPAAKPAEAPAAKDAKAAEKAEEEEEDDEDATDAEAEEYKKDYKSKLTAAMSQVRGRAPVPGEEPKGQLKFLAMVGTKGSSVLVAANVSGPARKVLKSLAGGAGGAFVTGQCIFEKNAHTFIVQTVPGGLAKKLSTALHAQTGMSYKVRVRTPDGSVVLDDETDVDPDAAATDANAATDTPADLEARWKALKAQMLPEIKTALGANPPNRADIVKLVGEANTHEKAAEFQPAIDAFTRLRPLLAGGGAKAATDEDEQREGEAYEDYLDRFGYKQDHESLTEHLSELLSGKFGDTGKMRAVMAFAEEKAAAGNFKSAKKALETLQKLVEEAQEAMLADGGTSDGDPSKVQFEKIHLDWDSNKQVVEAQLTSLRQAILAEFDDPEALAATGNLQNVLARFNEGLGDTIDAMRNSADATQRGQLAAKAIGIADGYLGYLGSSALVAHVEDNPYDINVSVRDTLSAPLNAVKAELAKASA